MPRASGRRSGYRLRNAKRDANEPEIIEALEAAGAEVVQLDKPCDLLVGFEKVTHLMEVKNPDGANRIEKDQAEFFAAWPGSPIHIVRTPKEALAIVGVPRRGNRRV